MGRSLCQIFNSHVYIYRHTQTIQYIGNHEPPYVMFLPHILVCMQRKFFAAHRAAKRRPGRSCVGSQSFVARRLTTMAGVYHMCTSRNKTFAHVVAHWFVTHGTIQLRRKNALERVYILAHTRRYYRSEVLVVDKCHVPGDQVV